MANRIHNYELMIIANAALDEEALATLNGRISGWITSAGGTLTNTNVWGRRNLAYMIGKHTAGIYVQFDFQLDPSASRELERSLKIEEQVIRHMIMRTDED